MKNAPVLVSAFFLLPSSFCLLPSAFAQGPLTPSAAPAPIFKTLAQIEPRVEINATNTPGDADSIFHISEPGSYYLSGNVTGVAAQSGIEIAASNVVVDLMGFTLLGVPGSLQGITAGSTPDQFANVAVRNGSASRWGNDGVSIPGARGGLIENVMVATNGSRGIVIGKGGLIRECSAVNNVGVGIVADAGSLISDCAARGNVGSGFLTGGGVTVQDCVASENRTDGINLSNGCSALQCTARGNAGHGIIGNFDNLVIGCVVSANSDNGIVFIGELGGNRIADCSIAANGVHGIQVTNDCLIVNNLCDGHSDGAGIRVIGSDTRVERNHLTDNDQGILVTSTGNLVIANSASGSAGGSNYVIAAGNSVGTITNVSGIVITVANPWANFEF